VHRNMGVHISFVRCVLYVLVPMHKSGRLISDLNAFRSTNLDSWQLHQLRNMKIGGNASATDFFTKHGGTALLNDSDTKKKYSSPIAGLYKEELARRVKEDALKCVPPRFDA
jgi:ADP-ribosylation factor GTPase-activating protein 2/3